MNNFISVIRRYAEFSGRATRYEYWMFQLFSCIFSLVLTILDNLIFNIEILSTFFSLFILCPSLALLFRRLHDTNRSGWWWLLMFVPLIGWIWLFILCVLPGSPGLNKYGHNAYTGKLEL